MVSLKHGRPITADTVVDASEFYGLSTDTKPTGSLTPSGIKIPNGAAFLEIDTGDIYLYDAENVEWNKM